MNPEVSSFLDSLNHPLRKEIELLRKIILQSHQELDENIKWNGPNYTFHGDDRITMKIHPPKQVQLIFHRGAKKQDKPSGPVITDDSGLLQWRENDRAIAGFKTSGEIENNKVHLEKIIRNWLKATS